MDKFKNGSHIKGSLDPVLYLDCYTAVKYDITGTVAVPTADCPSVKQHRPDIQEEFVRQWHSVMYEKVIFRILECFSESPSECFSH